MHEKTLIIPLVNEITLMSKPDFTSMIITYGEYSGLTPETILHELSDLLPDYDEELKSIRFEKVQGQINCLDCGYSGLGGKVYADPIGHSEHIVTCPDCGSTTTVIIQGRTLSLGFI